MEKKVKPSQRLKRNRKTIPTQSKPQSRISTRPKLKPLPKLIKEADKWFSQSIRLRDSERGEGDVWSGKCITCSKQGSVAWIDETGKLRFVKGWDAGHFVSRGNKVVRFNDENVNLQCSFHCNKMKSGNITKYRIALREKYGDEVPDNLEKLAEETQYYKLTREELEQIINDSKENIRFYAENHRYN